MDWFQQQTCPNYCRRECLCRVWRKSVKNCDHWARIPYNMYTFTCGPFWKNINPGVLQTRGRCSSHGLGFCRHVGQNSSMQMRLKWYLLCIKTNICTPGALFRLRQRDLREKNTQTHILQLWQARWSKESNDIDSRCWGAGWSPTLVSKRFLKQIFF